MALSIVKSLEDIANWIKKAVFRSPIDIWTNPNPSATMASIVVWEGDVTKYERFEIECDVTVNETKKRKVTIELYPGADTWAFYPGNFNANFVMHMYGRVFYTDSRGICCGPGRDQGFDTSGANTYNHLLVPQRITGFKTLGGYCVKLGGGFHAKLAKMFTRHRQCLAEDFCWYAERQSENRSVAYPMGQHINERLIQCKSSREIYNVPCGIFSSSRGIRAMHLFDKLFGFVQYHSKQHYGNSVQYGIQKQLHNNIYDSGCLDSNRQSIAPRGCCHV